VIFFQKPIDFAEKKKKIITMQTFALKKKLIGRGVLFWTTTSSM
jgi:hypothetical protein